MFSTIQMRRLMMAVGLGLFTGAGAELLAAPQGAQVVSGSASITRTGNLTQINAGNNAIINYQSFNIGAAETVRFVQPTAQSRVLNRVLSADPSYIYG
jgi:large exoprotein involved in heme utilization and adhesion